MLVRFNVKNFLSFNKKKDPVTKKEASIEFSMLPTPVNAHLNHVIKNKEQDVLRIGALYGKNGSGKTNLIKAISFFQKMVKEGSLDKSHESSYCKIEKENKNKPSYFEMEILLEDKVYSYGFEIILSENKLISEWLIELNDDKDIPLFYKDGEEDCYHFENILKDNQALDIYQQGILGTNVLFLNEMNRNKESFYTRNKDIQILSSIYNIICDSLEIDNLLTEDKENKILFINPSIDKIEALLHIFGFNVRIKEREEETLKLINDLSYENKEELKKEIESFNPLAKLSFIVRCKNKLIYLTYDNKEELKTYSLQFIHENNSEDILFSFDDESEGFKRIFSLIKILLSKDKIFIIDELDKSLHPNLTKEFIKNFVEYTQDNNVQLIATLNETKVMNLSLLRRDEIWFVNKDNKGNSYLYSLAEFNDRFDNNLSTAYIDGRYDL